MISEQLGKNIIDKLFICIRLVKTNLEKDIFTAVTTEKIAEELRLLNSGTPLQQTTATETTTRDDAVALNQSLKNMLESNDIPDNVMTTLRDTLCVSSENFIVIMKI